MQEAATDTRSRILEAAWALIRERGTTGVRVADIAAAAGVSRQLLYLHFESRAGLLVAMARHQDRGSGFYERTLASHSLPPVEALAALVREWLAYVPEILPVARALEAAAARGDEGAAAWNDRMRALHATFREALARVAEAGRLAPGWTVEEAADWLWARAHLTAWHHVVVERGWPPERYSEICLASVLAELIAPLDGPDDTAVDLLSR
jgi:AcrR family transcriptional regulator